MDALTWFLLAWCTIAFILYFVTKTWTEGAAASPGTRRDSQRPGYRPEAKGEQYQNGMLQQSLRNRSNAENTQPLMGPFDPHSKHTEPLVTSNIEQFPSQQPKVKSLPLFSAPVDDDGHFMTPRKAKASPAAKTTHRGESCEWLNAILAWLFRYYRSTPEVVGAWLRSLNSAAKKVANSVGCEVVFEELVNSDEAAPPILSEMRAEAGPRDHLPFLWLETLHGQLSCDSLTLRLVCSQKLPDRLLVTNYDAKIRKLSSAIQTRIACIANELFVMACFDGRPKMNIQLISHDSAPPEGNSVDRGLVEEAIRQCLTNAVTNLSLSPCASLPQPVEEVFRKLNTSQMLAGVKDRASCRHLVVKVVRAQRLGAGEPVSQPYVTVEMDEPTQKHTTSLGLNISPYWDEQFIFDLNRKSEELLFEIYDRTVDGKAKFLGLAIVGIAELRRSVSLTHALTLQSRPYRRDVVSGTLTVEFTFMDPVQIGSETESHVEKVGKGILTSVTSRSQRPLTTSPLRGEGEFKVTPTEQTTVTLKSVVQVPAKPDSDSVEEKPVVTIEHELIPLDKVETLPVKVRSDELQETEANGKVQQSRLSSDLSPLVDDASAAEANIETTGVVDLPRHPETRISRPRNLERSKSEEKPDKSRSRSRRTDSGSEASELSSESMYHHSTLVVELTENNVKRYYLIPPGMMSMSQSKKLSRRGKKLHIFNEHTFVAVRIKSSSPCRVCKRTISRGFGKRAYQCRDCLILCHKRCHYRTEDRCPNSTVSSLHMDYIWEDSS